SGEPLARCAHLEVSRVHSVVGRQELIEAVDDLPASDQDRVMGGCELLAPQVRGRAEGLGELPCVRRDRVLPPEGGVAANLDVRDSPPQLKLGDRRDQLVAVVGDVECTDQPHGWGARPLHPGEARQTGAITSEPGTRADRPRGRSATRSVVRGAVGYLPAARRCQRVRFSIFLCFFLRMRFRRFLISESIRAVTLPATSTVGPKPLSGRFAWSRGAASTLVRCLPASSPAASTSASATGSCSTAWASRSRPVASSACSAPTAPARPRSCGSSSGSAPPTPEPSSGTGAPPPTTTGARGATCPRSGASTATCRCSSSSSGSPASTASAQPTAGR